MLSKRPPRPSPLFPYTTLFRSGLFQQSARSMRGRHESPEVLSVPDGAPAGSHGRRLPLLLQQLGPDQELLRDRKSTRLNSSHLVISYAVFCLKKKERTTNSNIP